MMARMILESSDGVVPPSTYTKTCLITLKTEKKLSGESCDQNHADLTLLVHVFLSSTLL